MRKDNDPKKTARREARQQRRLPPNAVCISCGESAPEILEQHHAAGAAHDRELTAVLCKNCHGKATEGQLREDISLGATDNFPDHVAAILGALAAFFRFLADSLDRLASQVKAFAERLNTACPEWTTAISEES